MIGIGLVGMVHLPALPGTAAHRGESVDELAALAVADARVLAQSGFSALLLQNSLDRPTRTVVDKVCVAQMAVIAGSVGRACDLPLGINLHKNDGPGAMAVAAAVGASFIRVKVHTGAVISAEGVVTGCAVETLAVRRRLGCRVQIWADVHELTSRPLAGDDFGAAAVDAADFGAADALIITRPTVEESCDRIAHLRDVVSGIPLLVGGGTDRSNIATALVGSDGVIVGRSMKAEGSIDGPIDPRRATEIVEAAHGRPAAETAAR